MRIVLWCMLILPSTVMLADTLTLREAISIALQDNFDVQIARQDSLIAENFGDMRIVGFLPRLDVFGTYTLGTNSISQVFADGRTIKQDGVGYTNLNSSALVSWTIFDGLQMFASADRAKAQRDEGIASVRSRMSSLVADVITAYNAIVATQDFLFTADSALILANQRYDLEKYRYDVGTASGVELAQAEIDRNSQQALVIQTRTDLNNAKAALNTLLGRDPSIAFESEATLSVPPLPSRDELFDDIERENPDVISARYALTAASAHVREATASFMPEIALEGGYRLSRNTSDAGFFLENVSNGPAFGVIFRWNIFNGMSDRIERERRQILEQRTQLDIDAIRNDLKGLADRTLRTYAATTELLDIQQRSYAAAERNALVALEKLRVGSITPLEVRQTFQTLLEVGSQLATLEYEQRLAATELLRISGQLVR